MTAAGTLTRPARRLRAPGPRAAAEAQSSVRILLAVAAALPIVAYLWVALHRLGYAFELDWMEGGSVELAVRVASGHSLYVAPSLTYVGWTYTPLYYWIAAAVSKSIGVGFLPLRLVSFAASLVAMATLAWIVTRETGDRIGGLVAAGLFAAAFALSGAWFDTGRVDSLFLALTLLAAAWGRRAHGVGGGIGLGVLVFLAFFTKQTALVALLPVLGYLLLTRSRVGIPALVTLVVLVLASTAGLDSSTDGWYRYYVFSELAHQPWARGEWVQFWTRDILHPLWPAMIVVAGGLVLAWPRGRVPPLRSAGVYYAVNAAGLLGAAWVSRLHTGGYSNVLMPAYAAVALSAGLACAQYLRGGRSRWGAPLVAITLLLQLGLLAYSPGAQVPTAADRIAGAQLLSRLRALPGPVVVLRHPWYATIAGKGTFAQEEGISDVIRSAVPRGVGALRASLRTALDADHIQAVVLDGAYDAHFFGPELARDFRLSPKPVTRSRLYPLTDVRTAPTLLYVRIRGSRPVAAVPRSLH